MASRFTALPLSSGESFVLETDHNGKRRVILVDGGQSKSEGPKKNGLYKAIRKHCPEIAGMIDIAICTHRDHDHAGGFPAFVKTWIAEGNDIGEFWLPGGWAGAVELALTNPDRLVSMLYEGASIAAYQIGEQQQALEGEIESTSGSYPRGSDLGSIQSQIYEMCVSTERPVEVSDEVDFTRGFPDDADFAEDSSRSRQAATSWGFSETDWEAIRSDLETSEIHVESLGSRARVYDHLKEGVLVYKGLGEGSGPLFLGASGKRPVAQLARSLFRSSIDTAEAIRNIASVAAMFDIPVRWFDFAQFEKGTPPAGGINGFMHPVNAVELREVEREMDSSQLFFKLALTEQNVASLVFQRVETNSEPSVLFLGDSRLAFGIASPDKNFKNHLVQPDRPIVYTAPHHGSRNNDRAYLVLKGWLPDLFANCIAVRNGGVWNQTLVGYLDVDYRRCAQCYQCHGGNWSQLVQLNSEGPDWSWPSDQGGKCGVPKRRK